MTLLFLSPARTVLLVSDELLFVYAVSSRSVRLVASVPWDAENFEKDVASIISKDCGRRPVVILNDMVEQHYRKERVLRKGVGVLDRASMIERKLVHAFPNYPIRASFPLKEKMKKTEMGGVPADLHIFAAIPNSLQFYKTLEAVKLSLATISAVSLLPVEASDMVKKLNDKIEAKKKQKSVWTVFLGHHRSGGLRQIVTKNGEIALTRMTPITADDDDPMAWANEVFQAFTSTMSYVARFGYQAEDGLNVMAVTNPEKSKAFERLIEETYDFSCLTPEQAGKILGLSLGKPDSEGYADKLHAAWIGRKSKFILPMKAEQISAVSEPRKYAFAAIMLLILGAGFLSYQIFSELININVTSTDVEDTKAMYEQLQIQYEKEVQRKEALGFNIKLVQSSIAVYDALEQENIEPLALFKDVGKALGKDMRLDQIIVTKPEFQPLDVISDVNMFSNEPAPKPVRFEAKVQATFPSTTDIDKGNQEIEELRNRLASFMPGYDVEVTKFLKDYAYVEEITVETGDLAQSDELAQDFVVELVIKGRY